jgi:hypothetical protein
MTQDLLRRDGAPSFGIPRSGARLMFYSPAMLKYGQDFGAAGAVSETIRYSYFLPLALSFTLP